MDITKHSGRFKNYMRIRNPGCLEQEIGQRETHNKRKCKQQQDFWTP